MGLSPKNSEIQPSGPSLPVSGGQPDMAPFTEINTGGGHTRTKSDSVVLLKHSLSSASAKPVVHARGFHGQGEGAEEDTTSPREVARLGQLVRKKRRPACSALDDIRVLDIGARGSLGYRLHFYKGSAHISPWHGIGLYAGSDTSHLRCICTTPAGSWLHYEVAVSEPFNPVKLSKRDGEPSHYVENAPWNLGVLPQTGAKSGPLPVQEVLLLANAADAIPSQTRAKIKALLEQRGGGGGGGGGAEPGASTRRSPKERLMQSKLGNRLKSTSYEPLTVLDISEAFPRKTGEVYTVKALGAFAVVGKGPTLSWKIIAIDVNDPRAERLHGIGDVSKRMPGMLKKIQDWLQTSVAAESEEGALFLTDQPADVATTAGVIAEAHAEWLVHSPQLAKPEPSTVPGDDLAAARLEQAWVADGLTEIMCLPESKPGSTHRSESARHKAPSVRLDAPPDGSYETDNERPKVIGCWALASPKDATRRSDSSRRVTSPKDVTGGSGGRAETKRASSFKESGSGKWGEARGRQHSSGEMVPSRRNSTESGAPPARRSPHQRSLSFTATAQQSSRGPGSLLSPPGEGNSGGRYGKSGRDSVGGAGMGIEEAHERRASGKEGKEGSGFTFGASYWPLQGGEDAPEVRPLGKEGKEGSGAASTGRRSGVRSLASMLRFGRSSQDDASAIKFSVISNSDTVLRRPETHDAFLKDGWNAANHRRGYSVDHIGGVARGDSGPQRESGRGEAAPKDGKPKHGPRAAATTAAEREGGGAKHGKREGAARARRERTAVARRNESEADPAVPSSRRAADARGSSANKGKASSRTAARAPEPHSQLLAFLRDDWHPPPLGLSWEELQARGMRWPSGPLFQEAEAEDSTEEASTTTQVPASDYSDISDVATEVMMPRANSIVKETYEISMSSAEGMSRLVEYRPGRENQIASEESGEGRNISTEAFAGESSDMSDVSTEAIKRAVKERETGFRDTFQVSDAATGAMGSWGGLAGVRDPSDVRGASADVTMSRAKGFTEETGAFGSGTMNPRAQKRSGVSAADISGGASSQVPVSKAQSLAREVADTSDVAAMGMMMMRKPDVASVSIMNEALESSMRQRSGASPLESSGREVAKEASLSALEGSQQGGPGPTSPRDHGLTIGTPFSIVVPMTSAGRPAVFRKPPPPPLNMDLVPMPEDEEVLEDLYPVGLLLEMDDSGSSDVPPAAPLPARATANPQRVARSLRSPRSPLPQVRNPPPAGEDGLGRKAGDPELAGERGSRAPSPEKGGSHERDTRDVKDEKEFPTRRRAGQPSSRSMPGLSPRESGTMAPPTLSHSRSMPGLSPREFYRTMSEGEVGKTLLPRTLSERDMPWDSSMPITPTGVLNGPLESPNGLVSVLKKDRPSPRPVKGVRRVSFNQLVEVLEFEKNGRG